MATNIYVSYFNTFGIKSTTKNWHIEESRIRGGFNETSMNLGVRAYTVDEDYGKELRSNALIYSGIYNSTTGVNNTNVFSIAESITKAVDSSYGPINKIFADETNLLIIQEDKTQYALIDKDAIFSAEGGGSVTSSNVVIGQVVPYNGLYGTADPDSFVNYGGRSYWADRNRGAVLRLTRDGITEISNYGMRDFFRDNLKISSNIVGSYDSYNKKYVISLQEGVTSNLDGSNKSYFTLTYDEMNRGWVSFQTFKPAYGGSLNGVYYTLKRKEGTDYEDAKLYKHHADNSGANSYNSFYGATPVNSTVTFIVNEQPSTYKSFKSIFYEGDNTWKLSLATTDVDEAYSIDSYKSIANPGDADSLLFDNKFIKQDSKYYAWLKNNSAQEDYELIFGEQISGVKGHFLKIKMELDSENHGKKEELFSVGINLDLIR
jgi:hypothetical protein